MTIPDSKNLLIDADDTLWENNIYFERVIRTVQELLEAGCVDPASFRDSLNEAERRHIGTHGYGTVNFTRSLVMTTERFLPPDADPALLREVTALALGIKDHPVEVLEGVEETLDYLSQRHRLYLVTKGDPEEQSAKIEASNLRGYFQGVEILHEKNAEVMRRLLKKHSWQPGHTWMIGNSPRSDINPAIQAGISAVYIPHTHTWILEHEEPLRHARMIELKKFTDLRDHF